MNDPVDRLIMERQAMDRGLPGSLIISGFIHLFVVGAAVAAPFLMPAKPLLKVQDGFAVPLPAGGGGGPAPEAPLPAVTTPPTAEPQPAPPPEPPPKVLKPPKEEPRPSKALPEPTTKKTKKKPEKTPPRPTPTSDMREAGRKPASGTPGGTGTSPTPGLEFGPPGLGAPGGSAADGDFYLASVQRKIWTLWSQQIKTGFAHPIAVTFTILADGSVTDVSVTQSSGTSLLDLAAQRAVYSGAPFGPLPKDYGTNRFTIQAIFKPTP